MGELRTSVSLKGIHQLLLSRTCVVKIRNTMLFVVLIFQATCVTNEAVQDSTEWLPAAPVARGRDEATMSINATRRKIFLITPSMTKSQGIITTDGPTRTKGVNRTVLLPEVRTLLHDVKPNASLEPTTATMDNNKTLNLCFSQNGNQSERRNHSKLNCDGNNEENNVFEIVASYMTYTIAVSINRYFLPVIVTVGVCGNFISMCVMLQRQNRHTSFSVYLGCLAVSDNCVLFAAGYYWVAYELQERMFHDVECKILIWMLDTFQQNGVLLILSVTLDRLVAVRYPLKAAAWCRARRAKIGSASAFVAVSLYSAPHLLFNYADKQLVCMLCSFDNILCVIHLWVTAFLAFAIPFVLLLSMNVFIIRSVRTAMKYQTKFSMDSGGDTTTSTTDQSDDHDTRRQSVASASPSGQGEWRGQNQQVSSKDRNLIAMLLLVSFMFLLLNAPRFIRIIIAATVHFEPTPERMAMTALAWHITNKLYFANNACNFFLYCLSGSKFRRDFKALITENVCWCSCRKPTGSG